MQKLSESVEACIKQQTFLNNEKKSNCQFIQLLSYYLECDSQTVHQSTGDADNSGN